MNKKFQISCVIIIFMLSFVSMTFAENGLVGYWNFDEGSGNIAYDSSGNGNDGIINGASWIGGRINGALSFDGINDYVRIPDSMLWDFGSEGFSVAAWVKIETLTDVQPFWALEQVGYESPGFLLDFQPEGFYSGSGFSLYNRLNFGSEPPWVAVNDGNVEGWQPNNWNHIVLVRRGNQWVLYKNGIQVAVLEYIHDISSEYCDMFLGRWSWDSGSSNTYLSGAMDEVKIYNYALTAEQIAEAAGIEQGTVSGKITESDGITSIKGAKVEIKDASGQTVVATVADINGDYTFALVEGIYDVFISSVGYVANLSKSISITSNQTTTLDILLEDGDNGLIGYWKFDEGEGNVAYDYAGTGNDGVINGATPIEGQVNGALDFDGTNDYVRIPDSPLWDFGTKDFSVEAWVKINSRTEVQPFWTLEQVGYYSEGVSLMFVSEIKPMGSGLNLYNYSGPAWFTVNEGSIGDWIEDNWHHIAFVKRGNEWVVYKDGIQVAIHEDSQGIKSEYCEVFLGRWVWDSWNSNYYLDGAMDEVKIYNYALTAEQILQSIPDFTPPEVVSATATSKTSIEVKFSEDLDETSVETTDFIVENCTVLSAVETSEGIVALAVDGMPTDAAPLVTIVSDITDLAGNVAVTGSSVQAVDKIVPEVLSVTVTPNPVLANQNPDTLQMSVIFSESMNASVNPLVSYDPEGVFDPQSCSSGTWSTTNKNNDTYGVANDNMIDNAIGDGVAVISVANAEDINSNVMQDDNSYSFIINLKTIEIKNESLSPSVFNPYEGENVVVSYVLTETAQDVDVVIKDLDGVVVRQLLEDQTQSGGQHSIVWDGRNDAGEIDVSTGNPKGYSCEITAQNPNEPLAEPKPLNFTADPTIPVISNLNAVVANDGIVSMTFDTSAPGENTLLRQKYNIFNSQNILVSESGWPETVEGPGQEFLWDSSGAPEGIYSFIIKAKLDKILAESKSGTFIIYGKNTKTVSSPDSNIEIWHDPSFTIEVAEVAIPDDAARAITTADPSLFIQSPVYDFTASGTFVAPAILIFNYDPILDGNNLVIRRYDGTDWVPVDNQYVDEANNRIIAEIDSCSLWAIFTKVPEVNATVDLDPDTLNLKSNGEYLTAYIELPSDVENINLNSIEITRIDGSKIDPISAELKPSGIGDVDSDGINDLMVKFNRAEVQALLTPGNIEITVEGNIFEDDSEDKVITRNFTGNGYLRVIEPGKAEVISNEGGEIKNPEGVQLNFKKGSIKEESDYLITVNLNKKEDALAKKLYKEQKLEPLSEECNLEPCGLEFEEPVEVTIPFSRQVYNSLENKNIGIYYWNYAKREWELLENCKVDLESCTITATLEHFSKYRVMGITVAESIEPEIELPDSDFILGEVYAFPNPSKKANPTIHLECGVADMIEIKIYNIAAELIDSIEITGAPDIIGGKYAYEYTWNTENIASGVYLYLIRAYKDDDVIKSLKKLAVIK